MVREPSKRKIEVTDKRHRREGEAVPSADDAALRQFATGPVSVGEMPAGVTVPPVEQCHAAPVGEAPAVSAAPADGQPVDWQAKAAEYVDLAQRKEAELRNYRKRVQQDLEDARRFAVEGLLADLFPALDGLAQAAHTYRDKPDGADPLLDGVRRTVKSLEGALTKHGVKKINEAGVPFDAHLHQALNVEESAEATAETVADVYVEGYRMGDVVLKPAMVRVVKPQ
jgi:molecular chaperone GrpE